MERAKNALSGFGRELLQGVRENCNARLNEAAFEERVVCIQKATAALREAEVADDRIIDLLQKYWDLRLSEAKGFLRHDDALKRGKLIRGQNHSIE